MKQSHKDQIEKIGTVTSVSVHKATGKNWSEWIRALNRVGASQLNHQQIVALLKTRFHLTPWWQQIVTGCYEVYIGRRLAGQSLKGDYSSTSTKSVAVPRGRAWKKMMSAEGLAIWLRPLAPLKIKKGEAFETETGAFGEIRTIKAGERLRLSWRESDSESEKASTVQVIALTRPKGKCLLVIQHDHIKESRKKKILGEHWKQALENLKEYLTK